MNLVDRGEGRRPRRSRTEAERRPAPANGERATRRGRNEKPKEAPSRRRRRRVRAAPGSEPETGEGAGCPGEPRGRGREHADVRVGTRGRRAGNRKPRRPCAAERRLRRKPAQARPAPVVSRSRAQPAVEDGRSLRRTRGRRGCCAEVRAVAGDPVGGGTCGRACWPRDPAKSLVQEPAVAEGPRREEPEQEPAVAEGSAEELCGRTRVAGPSPWPRPKSPPSGGLVAWDPARGARSGGACRRDPGRGARAGPRSRRACRSRGADARKRRRRRG